MSRFATFVVALATALVVSCGGSPNPNTPSPTPTPTPTPAPVMAPPPAGVSATVWQVAFFSDNKLHRPLGAVHVVLPAETDDATRRLFVSFVAEVSGSLNGKTPMDTTAGTGANFTVSVNPGLTCGGVACTRWNLDPATGEVLGGTIEFASIDILRNKAVAKHELYRTLGMVRNNELPGLMSAIQSTVDPTTEELAMFLGRYNYPLLAVFTDH